MNSPTVSEAPGAEALDPSRADNGPPQGVVVRYQAPQERLGTFKEYAIRRLQRRVRYIDFFALDAIDLEVLQGEIFGIIGRNGAGKSTLLKVVSRVPGSDRGAASTSAAASRRCWNWEPASTQSSQVVRTSCSMGRCAFEHKRSIGAQ